ncbi:MAG TPA: hypothetical protein VJJ80_03200 [Patescibacteria group bacterium]|nr:hypothetical protein [Patescibacteria group bacterium]
MAKKDLEKNQKWHHHQGMLGGGYFLGMIGAAVYFVQQTSGFWPGVSGVLKALVWPAFLIHRIFELLMM